MKTVKVGLDIGNSTVKGNVLAGTNALLSYILTPSAVNFIHDERQLSYPEPTTSYTQVLESPLAHDSAVFAIGNRAMDIPGYSQFDVGSTSYKTNHILTTSLLFGTIGDLVGSEEELTVLLAVSVPIVESKTYGLTDEYQKKLIGNHKIRIYRADGVRDVIVHVVNARVLNEGQAGFLGLLDTVDHPFRKTMQKLYKSLGEASDMITTLEDFLVVDIGEGTTDLAVFRGKRFNAEYSYSVTKGYGTILELAMSNAEREGVTIESRKILQSLLTSTSARRAGERKRWDTFMDPERRAYVDEVVATVLKTYQRSSYLDAIVFLGGGFSALTGYTLDEEGQIAMTNDYLFQRLGEMLERNNKTASVIFGIPAPYAQSINSRGLMQVLTSMPVK